MAARSWWRRRWPFRVRLLGAAIGLGTGALIVQILAWLLPGTTPPASAWAPLTVAVLQATVAVVLFVRHGWTD
jgi:uncharacterized membrane protein YfcA